MGYHVILASMIILHNAFLEHCSDLDVGSNPESVTDLLWHLGQVT